MYKLGMAAILVVTEFLIARFTGLDMGRFMKWHYSNVVDPRFAPTMPSCSRPLHRWRSRGNVRKINIRATFFIVVVTLDAAFHLPFQFRKFIKDLLDLFIGKHRIIVVAVVDNSRLQILQLK